MYVYIYISIYIYIPKITQKDVALNKDTKYTIAQPMIHVFEFSQWCLHYVCVCMFALIVLGILVAGG